MAIDLREVMVAENAWGNLDQMQRNAATSDDSAPWGYWRKPDGMITFLPYGQNSMTRVERGYMPLRQYGNYKIASGRNGWQVGADPYLMLVAKNGVREMTAEQITGLGWMRRPGPTSRQSHQVLWQAVAKLVQNGSTEEDALREVFPQFAGLDLPKSYFCEFCPPSQRQFNSPADVRTHESVMHQDQVNTREMRDSIVGALEATGGGGSEQINQLGAMLVKILENNTADRQAMMQMIMQVTGGSVQEAPEPPPGAEPGAQTAGAPQRRGSGAKEGQA